MNHRARVRHREFRALPFLSPNFILLCSPGHSALISPEAQTPVLHMATHFSQMAPVWPLNTLETHSICHRLLRQTACPRRVGWINVCFMTH